MLSEALALLKEEVENNGGVNLEELVEKINQETNIEKDLLIMFANLFSERVFLAKDEDISLDDREVKDWMRPEVEIIMLYMESRNKYEKVKVKEAFDNLADLLGKTALGVQYKYYDERKVLKNPEMKRGRRGRRPKEETPDVSKNISLLEKEKSAEKTDNQSASEEHKQEKPSFPKGVDLEDFGDKMLSEDDKDSSALEIPSTQELDMIQMLSGMINNFKHLSDLTGDKNNKTMRQIVEGIFVLSSIAASSANDAGRTRLLRNRNEELAKENELLKDTNQEIKNDYKVLVDKIIDFQNSSDADKLTNLYTFLNDIEKEALERGAYTSPIKSYELNNEGQVVGIRNDS